MANQVLPLPLNVQTAGSYDNNLMKTRNTSSTQISSQLCNENGGDNSNITDKNDDIHAKEIDLLEKQLLDAESRLIMSMTSRDTETELSIRQEIKDLRRRLDTMTELQAELVPKPSTSLPKVKSKKNKKKLKEMLKRNPCANHSSTGCSTCTNKNVPVLKEDDRDCYCIRSKNSQEAVSQLVAATANESSASGARPRQEFTEKIEKFSGNVDEFNVKKCEMENLINEAITNNLEENNQKSVELFENALAISNYLNATDEQLIILYECYQIYFGMENYWKALRFIEEYVKIVDKLDCLSRKCKGYRLLRNCYMKLEKYDQAEISNQKYLEYDKLYKKLFDSVDSCLNFKENRRNSKYSAKSMDRIIDNSCKSTAHYKKAIAQLELQQFEGAIFDLEESLALTDPKFNQEFRQLIFSNLILAYLNQARKLTKELAYANKSEIFKLLELANGYFAKIEYPNYNYIETNYIYGEVGRIYLKFDDETKAIEYFKKQFSLSKTEKCYLNQIKALQEIGNIHIAKKSWFDALCNFYHAYEISKLVEDPLYRINMCKFITSIHYKARNYAKTIKYADECLNLSMKIQYKDGICDAYNFLIMASKELNHIKNALIFAEDLLNVARGFKDDNLLQKVTYDIEEIQMQLKRKQARSLRFWRK